MKWRIEAQDKLKRKEKKKNQSANKIFIEETKLGKCESLINQLPSTLPPPLLPLLALYFLTLSCLTLCYFTLFSRSYYNINIGSNLYKIITFSFVTLYKPGKILITINTKICGPLLLVPYPEPQTSSTRWRWIETRSFFSS